MVLKSSYNNQQVKVKTLLHIYNVRSNGHNIVLMIQFIDPAEKAKKVYAHRNLHGIPWNMIVSSGPQVMKR